jgi:predicted Zn-dependent peptidase
VTADELKKAKEYLRGKLTLTLEDSENVADWYAKQELLQHRTLSPEAKMKLFDRVTLADIKAVARDIFRDELLNLAVIGPFKDEKYFLNLLK